MKTKLQRIPAPAWYGLWILLSKAIAFAMLPITTYYLMPAEYGVLDVLATLVELGGIVLGLGLVQTLYRYGYGDHGKNYTASIYGLACVSSLCGLLLIQISAPWIASWLPEGCTSTQVRLAGYTLVLTALIRLPLARMQMDNLAPRYVAYSALQLAVQVTLVILLLHLGYGIEGVLFAGAVACSLSCILLMWQQSKLSGIALQKDLLKPILRYGAPLIISGLAMLSLGNLDFVILANAVGTAELAIYAVAVKIAIVANVFMQPFEMWWHPRRLKVLESKDGVSLSADVVYFGVIWANVICFAAALAAPQVIQWLTPESYHAAGRYVAALCFGGVLAAISSLANVGCYSGESGKLPAQLNLASAIIALALYLLFIPQFGIAGAVFATLAAYTLRCGLFYHFSQARVKLPYATFRVIILVAVTWLLLGVIQYGSNAQTQFWLAFVLPWLVLLLSVLLAPQAPKTLISQLRNA